MKGADPTRLHVRRPGVFRWIEALAAKLYVSVEAGHLAPESRVGMVGCCGRQGGSFGFEPGPAEHGSQLRWGLACYGHARDSLDRDRVTVLSDSHWRCVEHTCRGIRGTDLL